MKLLTLILVILFNFNVYSNANDIDDFDAYDEAGNNANGCKIIYDPYEKLNRKIYAFNSVLDYYLLRPVTIGYKKLTNNYTRTRISSFIENIDMPLTVVNYGLQANYNQSMTSLWRFMINSTFGMIGLFDVASELGITVTRQTFGSTLAHYGAPPGPYLIIPLIGSTNARDASDQLFTNNYLNPIMSYTHSDFKRPLYFVGTVSNRLAILSFTDYIMNNSTDSYIAVREASHQNRESAITYPVSFICPLKVVQKSK